jgi:23S rRNA (guanosine2251-2'-O)-methyltransferase
MDQSKPTKRREGSKTRKPRHKPRTGPQKSSETTKKRPTGRPDSPPAHDPLPAEAPGRKRASGRGGIWLYGTHAVGAALENPARRLHRLICTSEAAAALGKPAADEKPGPARPPLQVVTRAELAQVLPEGAVHQGMAVLADPLPPRHLEDLLRVPAEGDEATGPDHGHQVLGRQFLGRQVLLVLDQVTDPQNCGAILRSAAAFGALAVIAPARHGAPENGALAKAASGALELVPRVEVGNLVQALGRLKEAGYWVLGLDEEGTAALGAEDHGAKVVLVLGAEGRGLRRLTRETCDSLVRLPTRPALPSLNVSNAAAVALYALLAK